MFASKAWVLDLLQKVMKRKSDMDTEYIDLNGIWLRGKNLPGIPTGVYLDDVANPIMKTTLEIHSFNQYQTIGITAYTDENSDCFRALLNTSNYLVYNYSKAGGGGITISAGIPIDAKTEFELGKGYFTIDDTKYTFTPTKSGTHKNSEFGLVFTNGTATDMICSKAELWDGTTLLRQYLPKKRRSDGAVGFLETVTNTFHTCTGKGTFKAIM